jgi:uncharacterized protein YggE
MKTKLTPIPFALLAVALAVLAAACGGAEAKVTVEKGLAAAAGQAGGTSIGAQPAGTPVPYAMAIASEEETARLAYSGVAYSAGSIIGGGGGGSLSLAPQLQGQTGITVQGYGSATVPADAAKVQFSVTLASLGGSYPYYPAPATAEVMPSDSGASPGEAGPLVIPPTPTALPELTEADLAPLIDAIKAQGVSDADIEILTYPAGGYYGKYGPGGSAQVTVNLDNPAHRVGPLVDAGTQAVNDSGTLMLQNVSVLYTVDDCSALLEQARRAAVEDGRENGKGLADALEVSLGELLAASEYAYSPFGPSPCQSGFNTSPYGYEGVAYDPAMPVEVQIISNVALTFAMS